MSLAMTLPPDIDHKKQKASAWFRQLRDGLCAEFEKLEQQVKGPHADRAPGDLCAKRGIAPTIPARRAAAASCR